MKKLLLSAAVAAALTTPAFAQSFNPDFGTGNINPPVASLRGNDGSAFAYAPQAFYGRSVHGTKAAHSYGRHRGVPYAHDGMRRDYLAD